MNIDVAGARDDTPGCDAVLHFNNAGAALMPKPVIEAYVDHICLESSIGGYEAADRAKEQHERSYTSIAALLGAQPDEIALMDSATRAWNAAFYGLALKEGDRIVTTRASYASNFIAFLHRAKTHGIEISVAPSDERGQVDAAALEAMLDDGAALIALTHVPTNGGLVNPAAEIGRIARQHDVPFLLDACQSAGQIPLDVETIGCDMLSATGRKFLRGPRGTGFLYVRRSFLERLDPMTPDLHSAEWVHPDAYRFRDDARRFELWESNVAAEIGLGAAVRYALDFGLDAIWNRVKELSARLRFEISRLEGVTVYDVGKVKCGIVTLAHDSVDASRIKNALLEQRINVSISIPNSTLLDAESRRLPPLIRASIHYYNTEEEIERFVQALRIVSSR